MPRRKREWKPLFWFSVDDLEGRKWKIYLSAVDIDPEFLSFPCDAYTALKRRKIFIDAGLDVGKQNVACLHELIHVAFYGARTPYTRNEHMVGMLEPRLAHILGLLGFQLPPRPNGYDRLHLHGVALNNHAEDNDD